jgi:hypothetical protein
MSTRQKKLYGCLGLLLLCLAGCALSSQVVSPESQFLKTQDDFMQRLRWRDYQGAAKHFTEPHQAGFLQQFRQADDLNVTNVRLESAKYAAEGEQMATVVAVEYFLLPSATLKTYRLEQQWSYFREHENLPGEWRITSLFPAFPGLDKP